MRRVTPEGPGVGGGYLHGVGGGPVAVGSAAWQEWLATPGPEHHTFTFPAADGGLHRAVREWRRGQPYWYVKVRIGSAIKRFYLGKPTDLDSARLETVAAAIAVARAAVREPP